MMGNNDDGKDFPSWLLAEGSTRSGESPPRIAEA
jgi:hypothetical protein